MIISKEYNQTFLTFYGKILASKILRIFCIYFIHLADERTFSIICLTGYLISAIGYIVHIELFYSPGETCC